MTVNSIPKDLQPRTIKFRHQDIEINEQFSRALELAENSNRHIFITGKAGSGKSIFLEYFKEITKKKIAVLAPTGVAALNVHGQTIHSFFRFPPHITLSEVRRQKLKPKVTELLQKIDAIIIDEISMVRADLLDCVDAALRLHRGARRTPFGGAQMIFIGDLYQLPPVVASSEEREMFKQRYKSPYFFSAEALADLKMDFIEFEKIYRQKDEIFIKLLNRIRNNTATSADLEILNSRLADDPAYQQEDFITLTTTNAAAAAINAMALAQIKDKMREYRGRIFGKFDEKQLPTAVDLEIKTGARVMLLNNDASGRWVNGSIGTVLSIKTDKESKIDLLVVGLNDGNVVEVPPYTWEMHEYFYDRRAKSLDTETVGSFTQYPVRLAWAVTIHKSQGKTFDNVIIDIGRGTFAHGQMYVALSRCRTLGGIIIKTPILPKHIWMDYRVREFVTQYQYKLVNEIMSIQEKTRLIKAAIDSKNKLKITYLKPNDEKSRRIIEPQTVGEMEYKGKSYLGLAGYCHERGDTRVFRVDRILEMEVI